MILPLVPAVTQFDGGKLAGGNCTMAAKARLMRYATGLVATGSQLRALQSDQSGGSSIPDAVRGAFAFSKGWYPAWAAPNDGPAPPGRLADSIEWLDVLDFLTDGYMVLVQLVYEHLPATYREQKATVGGHAFTLDAWDPVGQRIYVVDTIPRSGYSGRWIPVGYVRLATAAMAGHGKAFAAWARPLTPTEPDMLRHRPATSIGTATVTGNGHWTIDPATGKGYKPVAAGTVLRVFGDGWLEKPWPGQPSPTPMLNVQHPGEPFVVYALQVDTDWPRGFVRPGGGDCDDEIAAAVSDERRRAQGHRDAARADLDRI